MKSAVRGGILADSILKTILCSIDGNLTVELPQTIINASSAIESSGIVPMAIVPARQLVCSSGVGIEKSAGQVG
jgi:hypothetical protein